MGIVFSQEKKNINLISGALIEKQLADIGTAKNIDVKVFKQTNLETREIYKSILLSYYDPGSTYSTGRKYANTIELDEVESLFRVTEFVDSNYYNKLVPDKTEIEYKFKDDLMIIFYASGGSQEWRVCLKFNDKVVHGSAFLSYDSFKSLSELIAKAKIIAQQKNPLNEK